MVTHQRGVGLVTLKHTHHPKWALIKAVRPDVLVATEETYTQAEIPELEAELLRPGRGARADGDGEHLGAAAGHHHGQPGHRRCPRTTPARCAASWRRHAGRGVTTRPVKLAGQ